MMKILSDDDGSNIVIIVIIIVIIIIDIVISIAIIVHHIILLYSIEHSKTFILKKPDSTALTVTLFVREFIWPYTDFSCEMKES